MLLRAGTSGFSFDAWKGPFYDAKLPASKMLSFYAARLLTVEINNTFYKLPTEKTLLAWAEQVPATFRFALKASRYLTHKLRLKTPKEPLERFFGLAQALGDKLGPLLVQLPPYVKKDVPLLEDFLAALPERRQVALEFRHASWFDDSVYSALKRRGAALVVAETDDEEAHLEWTAPFAYVRLRKVQYEPAALARWREALSTAPLDEAYVFFKHEDDALGPKLAAAFLALKD